MSTPTTTFDHGYDVGDIIEVTVRARIDRHGDAVILIPGPSGRYQDPVPGVRNYLWHTTIAALTDDVTHVEPAAIDLPAGAVVRDHDGDVWERVAPTSGGGAWLHPGSTTVFPDAEIARPYTVLYTPGSES